MRAKWAYRICFSGVLLLAVAFLTDRVMKLPVVSLIAFGAALLCPLVALVLVLPVLMLAMAFLLAPVGIVILGIAHDHPVWKTFWFWILTVLCETVGILFWAWFDTNYRIRD